MARVAEERNSLCMDMHFAFTCHLAFLLPALMPVYNLQAITSSMFSHISVPCLFYQILVADRGRGLSNPSYKPLEERDMQKEYKRHDVAWELLQALQAK